MLSAGECSPTIRYYLCIVEQMFFSSFRVCLCLWNCFFSVRQNSLLFIFFASIYRADELETALMEMVKQDNRRELSAKVTIAIFVVAIFLYCNPSLFSYVLFPLLLKSNIDLEYLA
jgi:hypothetical protein